MQSTSSKYYIIAASVFLIAVMAVVFQYRALQSERAYESNVRYGGSDASEVSEEEKEIVTYRNDTFGFSFQHPDVYQFVNTVSREGYFSFNICPGRCKGLAPYVGWVEAEKSQFTDLQAIEYDYVPRSFASDPRPVSNPEKTIVMVGDKEMLSVPGGLGYVWYHAIHKGRLITIVVGEDHNFHDMIRSTLTFF